jgi:hypothetical protein
MQLYNWQCQSDNKQENPTGGETCSKLNLSSRVVSSCFLCIFFLEIVKNKKGRISRRPTDRSNTQVSAAPCVCVCVCVFSLGQCRNDSSLCVCVCYITNRVDRGRVQFSSSD